MHCHHRCSPVVGIGGRLAWLLGLLLAAAFAAPDYDREAEAVTRRWTSAAVGPCMGSTDNSTARRLEDADESAEDDCKEEYDIRVKITVFTDWMEQNDAELERSPDKKKMFAHSAKAIFVTILRAMMKNNKDQSSMKAADFKGGQEPVSEWAVVYPYTGDDGDDRDWGAKYHRLVYRYRFPALKSCKAREAVENLCVLLNTEEEVLQLALVRALDTCKLHPSKMISEAGKIKDGSLKTLIHVSPQVLKQNGNAVPGIGCGETRPAPGTAQGAFYLPQVPANAVRDSEKHSLGVSCIDGYDGKIEIVSFGSMFVYSGACVPARSYCPSTLEHAGAKELGEEGGYKLESLRKCSNHDVRLKPEREKGKGKGKRWRDAGLPEIYKDGQWRPICGHEFDKRSANLFCRVLGFREGTFKSLDHPYTEDAVYVGGCSAEDGANLDSCYGMITPSTRGECAAGKHVAIEVSCSGGPCQGGQCEPSSCPKLKASLNEHVRPVCRAGYMAHGQAVCVKDGKWESSLDFGCEYIPPKAPPVPVCEKPDNEGGSLQIIGCEQCPAQLIRGEQGVPHVGDNCHCEVKCSAGYVLTGGERETKSARCTLEEFKGCPDKGDLEWNPNGKRGDGECINKKTGQRAGHSWCCGEAWGESPPVELKRQNCRGLSRNMCLQSQEDADNFLDQECCWRSNTFEGGERCAPRGDETQITADKQPDACAVKPTVPLASWPQLPRCEKTCNYTNWDENLLDVHGCQNCLPKDAHKNRECACAVSCPLGFLKVGNIEEGPKTCGADLTFGLAPMCLRQKKVTCEKPKGSHWNAPNCKECTFEENKVCKCHIGCDEGFRSLNSDDGEKTCEKVDASNDLQVVQSCEALKTVEECMKSKQITEGETDPCGWSSAGFKDGIFCVSQSDPLAGSVEIFAPVEKAVWKDLPECRPVCSNSYAIDSDKLVYTGCDDCAPGVPCDCEVNCNAAKGYFPVDNGPKPGKRECSYSSEKHELVKFAPPPVCVQKCEKPSDAGGSRRITGCDDCLEGQVDCKCDVSCADGSFHNEHTGLEGHKTCSVLPNGGVGFADLPKCSPKCTPPNDQYYTLDVSRCPLPCLASEDGNGEGCNCQVQCFGEPSEGKNGKKGCILVPGEDGEPARAEWHPAIPSCLSPVWLKVNNAATGRPIAGVNVLLYSDKKRTRKVNSAKTDRDGIVWFHTDLPVITFSTDNGDGWVEAIRVLDRVKNCKDPKKCGGQVAISQRMQGADLELENDGCFFTGETWAMRVVLEWDATPLDLDLWGRWVHPDGDGGSEWVKYSKKVGWPTVHCDAYGRVKPDCLPKAHCEWGAGSGRRKPCVPINPEPRPKPKLILDVDKRQGYGPETLSFQGVKPGYYQIVVNRFGSMEDVRAGNPRIQIYLGGRSTQFKCEMPPSCTKESANWQAVNIWITEDGMKDGKQRYRVRLLHTEEDILKLRAYELVVRKEIYARTMCHGECWADMYNPEFEKCLTNPIGQEQFRGTLAWARRLANSTG